MDKLDVKLDVNPKMKPLFVDMIKSSSIPYTVDKVTVKNSEAAIYIQHDTSLRSGYLILNDINGTIQMYHTIVRSTSSGWNSELLKTLGGVYDYTYPWEKINEEIDEIKEELLKLSEKEIKENGGKEKLEGEIGDLLFSIINAARLYGIDPENSLERTNKKFISRFQQMEKIIKQQGKQLEYISLDEMNRIWEDVKKKEVIK